jgi:hypothetical protein
LARVCVGLILGFSYTRGFTTLRISRRDVRQKKGERNVWNQVLSIQGRIIQISRTHLSHESGGVPRGGVLQVIRDAAQLITAFALALKTRPEHLLMFPRMHQKQKGRGRIKYANQLRHVDGNPKLLRLWSSLPLCAHHLALVFVRVSPAMSTTDSAATFVNIFPGCFLLLKEDLVETNQVGGFAGVRN